MPDWIGYRWLLNRYDLKLIQPLRTETVIGPTRAIVSDGTTERRTVLRTLQPAPTFAGHLGFALKHEGVNLEALSRLFAVAPVEELETWVRNEPSGQYVRRAAFFFEALTGRRLNAPDTVKATYVPALDPELELTSVSPKKNTRWLVRDNLLGVPAFSPQVHLTNETKKALTLDVRAKIADLEGQFGADLVMRSAVWLTIKESRASFAIEHEQNKLDRIQRFAAVIEQHTGGMPNPLNTADLEILQKEILGPNALHYGVRRSPIFVGQTASSGEEIVHYIAPHWNALPPMLSGLSDMVARTVGISSVARAALISFGFIYIHPMVDGNGRISRFLINDVLRRDGVLPAPYIVPISVLLQKVDLRPMSYDGALETFSLPLTRGYKGHWSFGPLETAEDGVRYTFQFDRYEDALHAWRYPNLTRHVSFLSQMLETTIEQEMRGEARFLQRNNRVRARLKDIIEGPNQDLDRIIRSVRSEKGAISSKLLGEFPVLERAEIAREVTRAIQEEFPW